LGISVAEISGWKASAKRYHRHTERFKEEYLVDQTFFEPYPEELKDIDALTIYCDGKDYWKQ